MWIPFVSLDLLWNDDTVSQYWQFLHFFLGNAVKDSKKAGSLRFYKPKFSYIFCDMDGEFQLLAFYFI